MTSLLLAVAVAVSCPLRARAAVAAAPEPHMAIGSSSYSLWSSADATEKAAAANLQQNCAAVGAGFRLIGERLDFKEGDRLAAFQLCAPSDDAASGRFVYRLLSEAGDQIPEAVGRLTQVCSGSKWAGTLLGPVLTIDAENSLPHRRAVAVCRIPLDNF